MQTIQVQAIEGSDGAYRARRQWRATELTTVQVLDQDDDPPDIETFFVSDRVTTKVPDPHRIGRKSFAAIKADARLRIVEAAAAPPTPPAPPAAEDVVGGQPEIEIVEGSDTAEGARSKRRHR